MNEMAGINWKDTRLIYIMVFGIIYISSLAPVALPVPIVQWSRDFYETISEGTNVEFADPPREFGESRRGRGSSSSTAEKRRSCGET
jgi:hypothetical protein